MVQLRSPYVDVPDLDAAYQLTIDQRWGDGLPIIPPTAERIERMLEYMGLPPDLSLGDLPPSFEPLTVERVAINAVMAGCLPEYLPVVIAVMEAVLEPPFNMQGVAVTTCPCAPVIIVNGPIRNQLNINCRTGALGPGWRANATIGRTLRLVMQSVGGAVPGPIAKSMMGLPERYTFCFGEDEENSPWDPLHVERGLAPESSAVTVATADFMATVAGARMGSDRGKRLAELVRLYIAQAGQPMVLWQGGQPTIVVPSAAAQGMAAMGVTKADLKETIFERCRVPLEDVLEWGEDDVARGGAPAFHLIDGKVQLCRDPDEIILVVASGSLGHSGYHAIMNSFYASKAVTKPLRPAAGAGG